MVLSIAAKYTYITTNTYRTLHAAYTRPMILRRPVERGEKTGSGSATIHVWLGWLALRLYACWNKQQGKVGMQTRHHFGPPQTRIVVSTAL